LRSDFKKPIIKVIMLGDSGVGKTALFGAPNHVNVGRSRYRVNVGRMPVIVDIWDVLNQRELRQMTRSERWPRWDCCFLIYDITKSTSFHALKNARAEFLMHGDRDPSNFPFVVIGNKCDLHGERMVPTTMASAWCRRIDAEFQETSTARGYGDLLARVLFVAAERATRVDAPVYMTAKTLIAKKLLRSCWKIRSAKRRETEGEDSDVQYEDLPEFQPNTAGFAALAIVEQAHFRCGDSAGGAPGVEVEVENESDHHHSHGGHGRAVRPRRE
jgi:hypothetical protein